MKRFIVALVAIVAMLSGCAPTVWVKPGGTAQQFEQDKAACMAQAEGGTANLAPGLYSGYMTLDIAKNCLRGKGYTTTSTASESAPANAPTQAAPQIAVVRAPGQSYEEMEQMINQCAAAAATQADGIACLKRNHMIVMPEVEFSNYVEKAVAAGSIKASALKNGRPDNEADRIAVDKLVWADYGIKPQE